MIDAREGLELVSILLEKVRSIERENGRLRSQQISIFSMGCKEHAKGLAEGDRFPMYCPVCGKPHTGSPDKRLSYKDLRSRYDDLRDATEYLSRFSNAASKEADHYRELLQKVYSRMMGWVETNGRDLDDGEIALSVKEIKEELDRYAYSDEVVDQSQD